LRIVLAVGREVVVAFAETPHEALEIAINLLALRTELRPGWRLRIEVEQDAPHRYAISMT
jgi:hypothetical protein